ncbi:MAG TPA: L-glutamate gamma-semialdehyde dehydrogenase [Polyangiaceae bacterium]|nr:L-glutamate gamma-semialdehyde dehydrogenase [Polyangiaceae bacterium]
MGSLPLNEPVLDYAPGSTERALLRAEISRQSAEQPRLPLVIGGARIETGKSVPMTAPHDHSLVLGARVEGDRGHVDRAIAAALGAKPAWSALPLSERVAIFDRAAELLAGPLRQRLNAATLLGQSKTPHQAEIDAACELIDFLRFNSHYAKELAQLPLRSPAGVENSIDLRPLDGFVLAITPFNFTAIAGNLVAAPALLGNTVVWKPSPLSALSAFAVLELFEQAGLPPGVINLVQGDAAAICEEALAHPEFSGLHFTGSSEVFDGLQQRIARHLPDYRAYPRIVGECGGKDFIFAHPSADVTALAVAIVRGGFEYQGQKCSAASRVFLPRSLAKQVLDEAAGLISQIKVGNPADFSCFMGAVIGKAAFERLSDALHAAARDPECRVVAGGTADDSQGYFVQPSLIEVKDPRHELLQRELFGPVVAAFVYDDARLDDAIRLCDRGSVYALTGAIFAQDDAAIAELSHKLRFAAGNFYINDKPTGAVVGQQPFGGSRRSGTNDKAGSPWNLLRWASPRTIKRTFAPPLSFKYPYQDPDS